MAAAFLPSHRWPALERHLPVAGSALLSGVLTAVAGGLAGVAGYLNYASAQSNALTSATLAVAERQLKAPPGGNEISSTTPMFVNAIAPVAFVFFTPLGLASLYVVASGTVRAIAAAVDDPFGDPVLTGVDALAGAIRSRTHARGERRRRGALEGPEIPDRVVSGRTAAIEGADLVVVSARRKPDWTAGLIVIAGETWYRLLEPVERTVEGRLRTLYPLVEHKDLEVARRTVHYDLPARTTTGSG